ncbi:MAG: sulfide/dihydroorotate dehydrogenase-like FAD/NAD-binding protein [Oscillospiraceae bacterium]|jgi:ferredoxin--NADP+ reductase|nr:sulfide/dihydroorotate dehydrogenase-like FAD/NAD-binding protein [Oscillospiraceae bacterium]
MYEIIRKQILNSQTARLDIAAPDVAAKVKAGQFVILRNHEMGERYPLTVASANPDGTITLIYQKVGHSTKELDAVPVGGRVLTLAGPLGKPTEIGGVARAVVVGGGLGCAIAWPVARALTQSGAHVDMVAGFRTKDLVVLEEELARDSAALHICTDDGTYGQKGLVTDALRSLLEKGPYDEVFAIGPLVMMKFVVAAAKPFGIKTTVSMNPLMVDGTGLCGCCRVTVNGKARFACVDGPDFDGYEVDFDEAIRRLSAYRAEELVMDHPCRIRTMGH